MKDVRRLLCFLVIVSFAVGLHASVPSSSRAATLDHTAKPQFETATQQPSSLAITSTPADFSFYEEFYPVKTAPQEQPKTGVLHWVGSIIKKGRQKIALLSPQKFF